MNKFPDFRGIEFEDRFYFRKCFAGIKNEISEFTFANIFCWRRYFHIRVSCIDGFPVLIGDVAGKNVFYLPVFPEKTDRAQGLIEKLSLYASGLDRPSEIALLPERASALGGINLVPDRDSFDYVYASKDLAELPGKKYDGKRNKVRACEKRFPETLFINRNIVRECLRMQEEWFSYRTENSVLAGENDAIIEAFTNFEELGLSGIAVKIEGRIEAFTIGEPLNKDTFVVHFEKADRNIDGLYQYINRAYSGIVSANYGYINRESDMGAPGLRNAKTSYHPDFLLKKYSLYIK